MSDSDLIEEIAISWTDNGGDRDGFLFCQNKILERIEELITEKQKETIRFGENAWQRCDTGKGPCSCGAWH